RVDNGRGRVKLRRPVEDGRADVRLTLGGVVAGRLSEDVGDLVGAAGQVNEHTVNVPTTREPLHRGFDPLALRLVARDGGLVAGVGSDLGPDIPHETAELQRLRGTVNAESVDHRP